MWITIKIPWEILLKEYWCYKRPHVSEGLSLTNIDSQALSQRTPLVLKQIRVCVNTTAGNIFCGEQAPQIFTISFSPKFGLLHITENMGKM